MGGPPAALTVETLRPKDRLESWKEVAAYLNRSERTVRRWEKNEGLPVHRLAHDKRGSVYAFTWELDEWRDSRRQLLDAEPPEPPHDVQPASRGRIVPVGVTFLTALLAVAGLWLAGRTADPPARVPDPEAVRLVQLASFGGNAGRTQIETGIRYIQDALRRDAGYAGAWAALAQAHVVQIWFGEVQPASRLPQVRREIDQALRLDPSLGLPWRVLGAINHYFEWEHAQADRHFRRAMERGPGDPAAFSWFADYLLDLRRFDEARTYYRRAQHVAPRWLEPIAFVGNTYYFEGHPDLAIAEYERVLESEPNFGLAVHFLGRASVSHGDFDKGIALLKKSNELLGDVPFSVGELGWGLARAGRHADALALRDDLLRRRSAGYYPAYPIAAIEAGLGRADAALEWLERAVDERNLGFYLPSVDPAWDTLRTHPRFRAILRRTNLPDGAASVKLEGGSSK